MSSPIGFGKESEEQENVWLVQPYLQNPSSDAMTICWLTQSSDPGQLAVCLPGKAPFFEQASTPELKRSLAYHPTEYDALAEEERERPAYLHRVRIEGLAPGVSYHYSVKQGEQTYTRHFRTAPDRDTPVRFAVYSDSETEPESTGKAVEWPRAFHNEPRLYVVDQTEGYRQNLLTIQQSEPDFIAIAGDLVEKGGRQLDWDEFWRHKAGDINDLAGHIPILPAVGNHENYAGAAGGYSPEGAQWSLAKYQAYFETPDNGSGNPAFEDRYYRMDYGPITFITLDSSDGSPNKSSQDSNFMLLGECDGGEAPDYNPGSTQYRWLETQLADARQKSRFIFVQFHHKPYSIGPHGLPAGEGTGLDNQSGQPLRVLSPLFEEYGVAAVFCGHDEIYEHSLVNGVHYYDVGIGGDGLRGPFVGEDGSSGLPSTNPHQVFLAHLHAPETWDGIRLVSGGKHYGHLEVNVHRNAEGLWQAETKPVYVFPLMNDEGTVIGFEKRVYDDSVVLQGK